MSRWLWALLAGVVLVAIAAVFWTASNQTNVTTPGFARPNASRTCARSRLALRRTAAPSPAPPAAQRLQPPGRADAAAPLRSRSRRPMQDSKPPRRPLRPRRPPKSPRLRPVVAQEPSPPPAPAPPAEAPLPPPAPGREAQEVAGIYAPKSLAQLVGTWAYSAADCERLFQRRGGGWAYRQPVDKFAQAAIVESPKKILLPSAICRIEGASLAEGMLKVSADCEDSISYTPRSVMIALRSTTELVYSASGDAALATTLKKCAP